MTATPRIYSEAAHTKAKEADAALCSMDDPELYGEEMYRIGFGEAVSKQLLSDYKVIVLFPAKGQKDIIIYNSYLTVSNIPTKAYKYIVVNGKSAIEWVMERYAVSTHKESGIKNDPNDWAREHENPQYILDLLLSVITVSLKTVEIVSGLPKVEWV